MKCKYCPLNFTDMPCVGDELGHTPACDGVNPEHPKYNPDMAQAVIQHSTDLYNKKNNPHLIPPPTFAQKVINLASAVKRIAQEGYKEVDDDVYRARLSQCNSCEFRTDQWTCSHPSCGCFLAKKAKLSTEACPIGKWGFEFIDEPEVNELRSVSIDTLMGQSININTGTNKSCGTCGQQKTPAQGEGD